MADAGRQRWKTVVRSLRTKLVILIVIFAAVPVIVYQKFLEADAEKRTLLLESVQSQGLLIARALRPLLDGPAQSAIPKLSDELAPFAIGSEKVRVLFRPAAASEPLGFYYVASAPALPEDSLADERARLVRHGILDKLAATCEGNIPLALQYTAPDGTEEVITSITPIRTDSGCWAVISSNAAAAFGVTRLDRSYWKTPEVQVAAVIYIVMALVVMALFLDVLRGLRRFRSLSRAIRGGAPASFEARNTVPELGDVAREFDQLVETLRNSAEAVRRAAEDNAHAFKTPIAIIRQSLEPLKRRSAGDDESGRRSLAAIDQSLDRLDELVGSARRMDWTTAVLLDPPRERVDMSRLVEGVAASYGPAAEGRGVRVDSRIDGGVTVLASDELIETVVENLIENAVSFSPLGAAVRLALSADGDRARFVVEDEGPGVPTDDLERIFDRYYSARPQDDGGHFGIGLWIVRRCVEAVGGAVGATNRAAGGLAVTVLLPLAA